MTKKEFSKLVQRTRQEHELTLRDFAKEIGVNWVTVWRWENGRTCPKKDALAFWVKIIGGIK